LLKFSVVTVQSDNGANADVCTFTRNDAFVGAGVAVGGIGVLVAVVGAFLNVKETLSPRLRVNQ
jgi:hypothetical protein